MLIIALLKWSTTIGKLCHAVFRSGTMMYSILGQGSLEVFRYEIYGNYVKFKQSGPHR